MSTPHAAADTVSRHALTYEVVDVFTDRPFTGNPLAVVFGADGLAGTQLQAVAREFNLSETVFVLPPTEHGAARGASYRARIFTPERELPFAGHPSVGAAVTQLWHGMIGVGEAVQECGAGLLPVQVHPDGTATLSGGEPTLGPPLDPAGLLPAVGLGAGDLSGPPPRTAGCGLEFHYLTIRPDALARARVDPAAARECGVSQVSVVAWDAGADTARVRVFAPGVGVPEDPATGSAALGLGVYLVGSGLLPADGETAYTVHQGTQLHRPSVLACVVRARGGAAVRATVRGGVVAVARGEIVVPPFIG